tara:strand:- start:18 stop:641 length:624 start_codon:yes stop_codon:yes gene_type:complete
MTTHLEGIISLTVIGFGILGAIGALFLLVNTAISEKGALFNLKSEEGSSELINSLKKDDERTALEMEKLAKYYIKIFHLTKISYWFGVVFSLLGLSILMIMSFSDSELSSNKAIISVSCIIIIEIVSLLFVLISNKFQKKMDQLFNNLQKEKQRNVTKKLIESIDDITLRDLLRIELTLYYSGIKNNPVSINESIQKVITNNLNKSQ